MTKDSTATASPPPRTLADWVNDGHTLSEVECATLLDELARREVDTVSKGGAPGCLGPELVVLAGPTPTVLEGGSPDADGSVGALAKLAWFAMTGVTLDPATAPRRRHDVIEVAGPTLGPVVADLLEHGSGRRTTLERLVPALAEVRAALSATPAHGGLPGRHRRETPQPDSDAPSSGVVRGWAVAAASALVALVVLAVVLVGRGAEPTVFGRPTSSSETSVGPTLVAAPRTTSPVASAPVSRLMASHSRTDLVDNLRGDPRGVLQDIVTARTSALVARDADALAGCEVPGSPVWTADRGVIQSVAAADERYGHLELTVRSATVVSVAGDAALVDAVVDRSAYVVLGSTGTTVPRPAARGRVLRYELASTGSRWRLVRVADVAQTSSG